jgi:hypothetical protein
MSTRKFYEKKRRLFDDADEMGEFLLQCQPSALARAAIYVKKSHAQDIFDKAVEYFLKKKMWKKKYYCLSAFRKMFMQKIRWLCLDLLDSPRYALECNMAPLDAMPEDANAFIDQKSLPKALALKSAIEEIRNSLTAQEQELFDAIFYKKIKPRYIAYEQSKSVKTIRNKKSALLNRIRQKYTNGEYNFGLDEISALDRIVGARYEWNVQAFPVNESDALLD